MLRADDIILWKEGTFEITGEEDIISKEKNKSNKYLNLCGSLDNGMAGDFLLCLSNFLNSNACIDAWGDETESWKGKLIKVIRHEKQIKILPA